MGASGKTRSSQVADNHDPWPARGAGDIIGCLCGKWVELELKTWTGKWRELQIVRAGLVRKCGGMYLVVREGSEDALFERLDRIAKDSPRFSSKQAGIPGYSRRRM